jgi:hypothetical protein
MRSHTGGVLSLGGGTVYVSSTKQKLNIKSSTKSEIVGPVATNVVDKIFYGGAWIQNKQNCWFPRQ